jgi:hypothetical protein
MWRFVAACRSLSGASSDRFERAGEGSIPFLGTKRAYFASLRAASSNLRIVREQIIVDGNFLATRNTFPATAPASSPIRPPAPSSPPASTSRGK